VEDTRPYYVGFNFVKGIGAARMRILLDYFGDVRSAWEASPESLKAAGLGPKVLETFQKVRLGISLEQVMENLTAQGVKVLTWEDTEYPRRLQDAPQPPPVLYVRGEILPEDEWAIALVGTRRATSYGRQVAEEAASNLAARGVTIVSGLARGIDGIAHQAALKAGGRTIAVLGSGIDNIYPPEHVRLAEQISARGAVVTDYAPGTPPDANNFPPRNRIISGLGRAVIVVEASRSSGALITAAFAAEQGREVFAVPGNIYAPQSLGANLLIQQGARPYLSYQDVLTTLDLGRVPEQRSARAVLPADALEAQLYGLLGNEPLHVDELGSQTNLPIEKISATLVMMELKGLVRQVGGMQYIALREPIGDYQVD
jgi:DNA processing protein